MNPAAGTVVLEVRPPVPAEDLAAMCERVRRHAEHPGAVLVLAVLSGPADASVVDALARLALVARRHHLSLRVRCSSGEVRPLLHLCGLDDVVPAENPLSPAPVVCEPPAQTRGGP